MTVEISSGDLLSDPSEMIVIPVNTVGVMGAGLALAARKKWPYIFKPYRDACDTGELTIGSVLSIGVGSKRIVTLFPTKEDWRKPSTSLYITDGLFALQAEIERLQPASVAIPALGCGLGGLQWHSVQMRIHAVLGNLPTRIILYPPKG